MMDTLGSPIDSNQKARAASQVGRLMELSGLASRPDFWFSLISFRPLYPDQTPNPDTGASLGYV